MSRRRARPAGFQITTHVAVAILLLILFVSSAYVWVESGSSKAETRQELLAELIAQREEWNDKRPPYYEYVMDRDCDCPVEERTAYKVRMQFLPVSWFPVDVETESGVMLTHPESPVWLPELFSLATEAVEAGRSVNLRYSRRWGFIRSLSIVGDDGSETSYVIRDFEETGYEDTRDAQ